MPFGLGLVEFFFFLSYHFMFLGLFVCLILNWVTIKVQLCLTGASQVENCHCFLSLLLSLLPLLIVTLVDSKELVKTFLDSKRLLAEPLFFF